MADARGLRVAVRNRASAIARAAGPHMVRQVQAVTPVRTGALRRAWTYDLGFNGQAFTVTLRNDNERPRAEWLDESRPHVIVPVRAGRLRFVVAGGETVFARKVNHPGVHLHYISATVTAATWHSTLRLAQLEAA